MLKITKPTIRNEATNETVYTRGLRYYKNNAIINITWSNSLKQYRAIVKGHSEYVVTVDIEKNDSFHYNCNCPAYAKYAGACKHIVATLLFISDYTKRSDNDKPVKPEDKKINSILDYFERQIYTRTIGETFCVKVTIVIPSILKNDNSKAYVSLHAGCDRLYKIQSLKNFLYDYSNNENIILGKNFKYIYGESRFDEPSIRILDYLLEIYEIQESLGKVYYSNLFTKSQVVMTKNMLVKFLSIVNDNVFDLELNGKKIEEVSYVNDNPNIKYELFMEEDTITIDYNGKEEIYPLTENGELLYSDCKIYKPEKSFIKNYIPFYNNLGKDKQPLVFKGENRTKFLEVVLPKINETMDIDIPDEIKDKYIASNLKVSLYLDKLKSAVKAEVKFKYGKYEFNPLEDENFNDVIIVRQPDREAYMFDIIESLGFEQWKNLYVMKDEKNIYNFLSDKINEFKNLCEIYYSEDFKAITIKKPGKLTTNIKVKSDSNLLELDFDYEDVPKEELKELFHSFKLKKKFFRMKNGDFIDLNNENLEKVADIIEHLNLSSKDMDLSTLMINKNKAIYLNDVFKDSKDLIVEKEEEFVVFVDKILNPSITEYELPKEVFAELRPYQITGFKWLRTLAENGLGGILADDMGLGKTLQAITYMVSLLDKKRTHLVVCPSSLVYNWLEEINSFAPSLKAEIVIGTPQERQLLIQNQSNIDVFITSYPLIRRDIEHYNKIQFHTMFIDEAQFIKNANSLNAKSVKNIKSDHKFALTGTPIENSLSELWSIFDFIMPAYLLSYTKFSNIYEKPILKDEDTDVLEKLKKQITPFILRRMKKEVLSELPEKVETKMVTDMSDMQRKVYMSYLDNIRTEISKEVETNGYEKSQIKILAALTRLRQICCHPATFIDNYKGGSGKLDLLLEILEEAITNGHRILIFSQFTSMLKIIEKELLEKEIGYFYLEGSTPIKTRSEYVNRFNLGENSVFLISLKAGGTGLNLTGADTVIHYDPWWNPAVEEQATDRVYRIGQKNSVQVIKLITKGTIEEKIYKLQMSKKALSDSIIQSKEVFINKLSKEEIEDIFS